MPFILTSDFQILSSDFRLLVLLSFEIQVAFFQMQADRSAAEHSHLVDAAGHADAASARRRSRGVVGQDCDFSRPIIDPVKLEGHKRYAPGRCDTTFDFYGAVYVSAGIPLQFANARIAQR